MTQVSDVIMASHPCQPPWATAMNTDSLVCFSSINKAERNHNVTSTMSCAVIMLVHIIQCSII